MTKLTHEQVDREIMDILDRLQNPPKPRVVDVMEGLRRVVQGQKVPGEEIA